MTSHPPITLKGSELHERKIGQWRKDVTSAMYFLVWHGGMNYEAAEQVLIECRAAIGPLAIAGRREGRKCFAALSKLIDSLQGPHLQYPSDGG
jgi:hypothetical protein